MISSVIWDKSARVFFFSEANQQARKNFRGLDQLSTARSSLGPKLVNTHKSPKKEKQDVGIPVFCFSRTLLLRFGQLRCEKWRRI